ncbi:MAG: alpha/beta-type small acid-soluble spore protein [Firmicutes bacterium]|nr:alpha/beta-type small acid-soluble spore protein [Bacillota bacterium]
MPRKNRKVMPQAGAALDRLKYETAAELGIPNYTGYRGDLPSKVNGAVGGNMVRKLIALAESQLAGRGPQG